METPSIIQGKPTTLHDGWEFQFFLGFVAYYFFFGDGPVILFKVVTQGMYDRILIEI